MLKCSDESLYCGYTNDIAARVKTHNEGKGAKYTRRRLPVEIVFQENYPTKSEALQREYEIKKMTRIQKLALVQSLHTPHRDHKSEIGKGQEPQRQQ